MNGQGIVAGIMIVGAIFYLARTWWPRRASAKSACPGGCGGCAHAVQLTALSTPDHAPSCASSAAPLPSAKS